VGVLLVEAAMRRPRWLQHFIAWLLGYFWLPCPICGRMFGGQEVVGRRFLVKEDGGEWCVCGDCEQNGRLEQAQMEEDMTRDLNAVRIVRSAP
jgi:ribosome-binding protein aMBF1 (putative translation factor)